MKNSFKLSCDLVRCPDTSFLKLIPNHRETKMAVVVGGVAEGGGGGVALCRCEGWGLLSRLCFSKMSYHLSKIDQRYEKLCCIEYGYLGPTGTTPLKTSQNASPGKYTNCLDSW